MIWASPIPPFQNSLVPSFHSSLVLFWTLCSGYDGWQRLRWFRVRFPITIILLCQLQSSNLHSSTFIYLCNMKGQKNWNHGEKWTVSQVLVKIRNEGKSLLANLFSSKSWGVASAKHSKSHFSFSLSLSLVHTNTHTKCTNTFITLFHGLFMISGNCRDC